MTKEEFLNWKNHPVTQTIFSALYRRIDEGRDELEQSAGYDSISDAKKSGKLSAYREFVSVTFEDIE